MPISFISTLTNLLMPQGKGVWRDLSTIHGMFCSKHSEIFISVSCVHALMIDFFSAIRKGSLTNLTVCC
jgi:hypothetical protein